MHSLLVDLKNESVRSFVENLVQLFALWIIKEMNLTIYVIVYFLQCFIKNVREK